MLSESLLEYLAVLVVVLERAYLGDATKTLKGSQIQLVDMSKVRIGDDNIGQSLDIAEAMGKPGAG